MTSFKSFVLLWLKTPATGGKLSGNQNRRPAMLFKKERESKEFGLWPTLRSFCSARFVQMIFGRFLKKSAAGALRISRTPGGRAPRSAGTIALGGKPRARPAPRGLAHRHRASDPESNFQLPRGRRTHRMHQKAAHVVLHHFRMLCYARTAKIHRLQDAQAASISEVNNPRSAACSLIASRSRARCGLFQTQPLHVLDERFKTSARQDDRVEGVARVDAREGFGTGDQFVSPGEDSRSEESSPRRPPRPARGALPRAKIDAADAVKKNCG